MAQEALDGTGPSQQNEKESYFGKSCDQIVGAIAKAYFQGQVGGSESHMMEEPDKQQSLFQASGALMPLYDPAGLAIVYENSSCLRSCVDAYVTNIDGFGHQFVPIIDLSHPTAFEAVRNALRLERKAIKKAALLSPEQTDVEKKAQKLPDEPSDADIKARMEELAVEIAQEKMELEVFFNNCTIDMPFAGPGGLRGHTRESLEIIGNAYWEVLRDGLGKVAQFNHIPSPSMRIAPTDDDTVEVEADVRVSPLAWKKLKVRKRFRRFIQCWLDNTKVVYFKEFGDPRCISADTGRVYRDFDELKEKEGKDRPVREATEVFWFKINSLRTAYGAPRWIGTLLAVLGNRQAEEMNFIYFENRSVPPLAVLVSGGRLNGDSVAKLEDHIRNNIKGARNSHKILLIEAEPASSMQQAAGSSGVPSRMKIELKPLTEAQLSDAQFLRYGEDNRDKIGQAFRLPRMLRGDVRDFNRSTSAASIDFAEVQVFSPIRQEFDWQINTRILPALGARYHLFRSNSPSVRDPQALAEMIERMVKSSVLTPEEGRSLCGDVFNQEFPVLGEKWTKQPIAMTLAGVHTEHGALVPAREDIKGASKEGLDSFNENGGMSAPGAGATQEALGVSKEDKVSLAALFKDVFAGEQRDDDEDEEEDEDDLEDEKAKLRKLRTRALLKLHKHFQEEERARAQAAYDKMEKIVVRLPEEEMRSLFLPEPQEA